MREGDLTELSESDRPMLRGLAGRWSRSSACDYAHYPEIRPPAVAEAAVHRALRMVKDTRGTAMAVVRAGKLACAGFLEMNDLATEVFDLKFGQLTLWVPVSTLWKEAATETLLDALEKWAVSMGYQHLSIRVPASDPWGCVRLQARGYYLVETQCTYVYARALAAGRPQEPVINIREALQRDRGDLESMVLGRIPTSRFLADPNLDPACSNRYYAAWVRRAFRRGSDYSIWVSCENGRAQGFIMYKRNLDFWKGAGLRLAGQGLLGVGERQKGITTALATWYMRDVHEHYDWGEFDTHLSNIPINNICIRLGLRSVVSRYTFHRKLSGD